MSSEKESSIRFLRLHRKGANLKLLKIKLLNRRNKIMGLYSTHGTYLRRTPPTMDSTKSRDLKAIGHVLLNGMNHYTYRINECSIQLGAVEAEIVKLEENLLVSPTSDKAMINHLMKKKDLLWTNS